MQDAVSTLCNDFNRANIFQNNTDIIKQKIDIVSCEGSGAIPNF